MPLSMVLIPLANKPNSSDLLLLFLMNVFQLLGTLPDIVTLHLFPFALDSLVYALKPSGLYRSKTTSTQRWVRLNRAIFPAKVISENSANVPV